jgi:transcriptional antiterminator NusG
MTMTEYRWYALKTRVNMEKKVVESIRRNAEREGMSDMVGELLVPTNKTPYMRNGKQVVREMITYPGYVFVQTVALGELNMLIKDIEGCNGFVRTRGGEITGMSQREIDKMKNEQEQNDIVDVLTLFHLDETLTITDGPFSTFKGKVTEVYPEKSKLKLQVTIFGRNTEMELGFSQVEKYIEK